MSSIMRTRSLQSNVAANLLQTVLGTALLFLLYRFINTSIGIAQLGIWSVVLATVAVSHLTDLGLTAGITRFIARDLGLLNTHRAAEVIDTAMLTMAVILAVLALPLYFLADILLPYFFGSNDLVLAQSILPYALASLWFSMLSTGIQGALDGCQRMDVRAILVITGQLLFLILAVILIPKYGIIGLAWAQLLQGITSVVAGRLILKCLMKTVGVLPRRWNFAVLKEMLGYGLNIQASTVLILFFDPVTKVLLAKFGGPSAAGAFEMANQMVVKARGLIISANQAIVPYVAASHGVSSPALQEKYKNNVGTIYSIAVPMFSLVALVSPLVGWLLLGTVDKEFIILVAVLSLGWCFNVFNAPAYFFNMGTGSVHWNTWSHLLTGVLNISVGYFLGVSYGATGVICAYILSICAGSALLIGIFQSVNRINAPTLTPGRLWTALCPLVAALGLIYITTQQQHSMLNSIVPIFLSTICIGILVLSDKKTRALMRQVFTHFSGSRA